MTLQSNGAEVGGEFGSPAEALAAISQLVKEMGGSV